MGSIKMAFTQYIALQVYSMVHKKGKAIAQQVVGWCCNVQPYLMAMLRDSMGRLQSMEKKFLDDFAFCT
jgi:hypothetical protein